MLDLIFSGLEGIGTVIGAIATIIGAYFVSMQIKATRESEEKNELIKRKEVTLNAYRVLIDNVLNHNNIVYDEFNLIEKTKLSEENMLVLKKNSDLLKHLDHLFEYINQLAIGTKQGIYDLDTLIEISGRLFVRLYDRYELYIKLTRESYSESIYKDMESFIEQIRKELIKNEDKV
ncbi:MAG: Unknown protein [uncultured Sulfurovum sp.]|uniref:Uncharacterized protein n=1 Tax=uncultured Sulfurovum sp. TaxID=269237 RepID=A0A6S6SAS4_9BACT|nr:MAG: Unknown protein [uncultured Sulfurovum sp.]